jgi:hypothetical protein
MPIDLTKPVQLITKAPLLGENGNYYSPGVYRPGELPAQFLIDTYCRNVGEVPVFSAVAGDGATTTIPDLQSPQPIPAISKLVEHDLIDINTADIGKIMEVQGIGTSIANKIVVEREAKGAYKDLGDLMARIEKLVPLTTTIENRFKFG